jgi:hypothetical protein
VQRRQFVSRVLAWGFAGASACGVTGCGTFLHSERCGRPHSNRIDWKIAALDGLGLLLFFVPGVVAFVVDFSTGTIYLPLEPSYPAYGVNPQQPPTGSWPEVPAQHSTIPRPANAPLLAQEQSTRQKPDLKRVVVPRGQLQQQRIEQIATRHLRQRVSLDDSQARASVLPCIERFDEQASRHRRDRNFGVAAQSFFERLKQRPV